MKFYIDGDTNRFRFRFQAPSTSKEGESNTFLISSFRTHSVSVEMKSPFDFHPDDDRNGFN